MIRLHNRRIISFAIAMTILLSTAYGVNGWSSQVPKAQERPHGATGSAQAGAQVPGPLACRVSQDSTACLNYKLERLTERINQLELKQNPGPPVEGLPRQGDKADGPTEAAIRNLQAQLDALWDRVSKLIDRTKK